MLFVFICKARLHNDHNVQCMPCHAVPYNMSVAHLKFEIDSSDVFCRAAAVTMLGQSTSRATEGGLLR